jgi:Ulp1 family protease
VLVSDAMCLSSLSYHRISRDDTTLALDFHFFTSHFYATLAAKGPKAVESWTRRKKITVFEKKLIFVPINKDLHWSLCIIVNPGAIVSSLEGTLSKNDSLCLSDLSRFAENDAQ